MKKTLQSKYLLASLLALASCGHLAKAAEAEAPTVPKSERKQLTPQQEAARQKATQAKLAEFNYEDHLLYKTVKSPQGGEEKLEFTLFKPKVKPAGKLPLVVYTHGGGWANLDRFVILWPNATKALHYLTDHGIAVASVEYRLTRRGISTAYDCVVDCKDAARYLVANAERFGIDPERIGTWGGSAGGHLCLMTALAPNDKFIGDTALKGIDPKFRCVCSWFPATSFLNLESLKGSNFDRPQRFVPMLGGDYEEHKDLAKLLSPAEYVKPDGIPVLLIHGDKDRVLPLSSSQFMLDAAKRAGDQNVQLQIVKGADHGFGGEKIEPSLDEVQRMTGEFLAKHLSKP